MCCLPGLVIPAVCVCDISAFLSVSGPKGGEGSRLRLQPSSCLSGGQEAALAPSQGPVQATVSLHMCAFPWDPRDGPSSSFGLWAWAFKVLLGKQFLGAVSFHFLVHCHHEVEWDSLSTTGLPTAVSRWIQ